MFIGVARVPPGRPPEMSVVGQVGMKAHAAFGFLDHEVGALGVGAHPAEPKTSLVSDSYFMISLPGMRPWP